MKYALIAAALLLTSHLAHAGSVPSNFEDPNNKYSQMGQVKKACWKTHATGGDTTDRVNHPESQSAPSQFERNARSRRAT
jgi:hypothetical protein